MSLEFNKISFVKWDVSQLDEVRFKFRLLRNITIYCLRKDEEKIIHGFIQRSSIP